MGACRILCSAVPNISPESLLGRRRPVLAHSIVWPALCRTISNLLGANRSDVLLMQGEAYIAEPRPGDPHPFPAVRGLGSCSDVGQSGVQLGQFQAPFSSRVEVPARDGFVQEPFSFAVVIWTVHSVLFGRRSIHPWPGARGLR